MYYLIFLIASYVILYVKLLQNWSFTCNHNICSHPGRRGGILPHRDLSSTGFYELPSPYTCSSSCCWFWPAWCLCLKRTTAVHCPTTSPAPSTPCCATPTALRPHEHCHDTQRVPMIWGGLTDLIKCEVVILHSVKVYIQRHLLPATQRGTALQVWRPHLLLFFLTIIGVFKYVFIDCGVPQLNKKKPYHWFVLKFCHFYM